MCTVLLPPGDNPIAVNKYINITIKVYVAVHEELSISIQNLTGNKFTRSKNL